MDNASKTIYVLFEESNGKEDWKNNFDFLPVPIKPYKRMKKTWFAHKGFVKVYHSVRDKVMNVTRELIVNHSDHKVVVGGWSHGGALAQLCAEDIYYNLGVKPTLTTFGSPRVFYGKVAERTIRQAVADDSRQYENGSDIVPKVPPFARCVRSDHIGDNFNLWESRKTAYYHCDYGNEELYR